MEKTSRTDHVKNEVLHRVKELYTVGLFDREPSCKFCRKETESVLHIICGCETLACQCYNVFGNPLVETKDISTVSVRDPVPIYKGERVMECVLIGRFSVAQ
jgi:hypothetical protein